MPRYRPLSLPRVPLAQQLTANLIPDPVTPTPAALLATPVSFPSLLRRARAVRDGAHFSYVSPLPLPFPYNIPVDDQGDPNEQIERVIRLYEAPVPPCGASHAAPIAPGRRSPPYPDARLVAFSPETHASCVPHLDVGDTPAWIASTSGQAAVSSGPSLALDEAALYGEAVHGGDAQARQALSEWASGRAVSIALEPVRVGDGDGAGVHFLARDEDPVQNVRAALAALHTPRSAYAPWSLRYGGHQFGEWAGQLGDGRAVSLVETAHPATGARWDMQLKGAGRTPYSRFADGLATLKSSVREFLASEYMAALQIPTSRALCVVSLSTRVECEREETAAVTLRLAPSWLRIGSFEIHSSRGEWESVRVLGEYVARELFGWADVAHGAGDEAPRPPWALRLVAEVGARNARTWARWQAHGFMHGVLNTDNIALHGETIDYGPYGFMDVFDADRACNHSDWLHRYTYRQQPAMLVYAIERLLDALAPLIGFEEAHGRAPRPGELLAAPATDLALWTDAADAHRAHVCADVQAAMHEAWTHAWAQRLGIAHRAETIQELVDPLLDALRGLDMTLALRALCAVPLDAPVEDAARAMVAASAPPGAACADAERALAAWLRTYVAWRTRDARDPDAVRASMHAHNPAFVLRNWVTDAVAERLEHAHDTAFLERVRALCARPYDVAEADAELCRVGVPLHAHLPSCSS
ncbi:hypothetical protein MCAP1_003547 [Malassezia caprae]|uniref:Selenoprotein O n=1 Tax=Malassezia caprae TaxID=1381934 RepID=A0AAF0EEM4_9BASI|nr:hypothetical protein MCAP1_003547 [Malassezia caprae]